jgi:hypothetical protein
MTNDEIKDLLTPGSVWLRRDGAQIKVLFYTNQSLTSKQQEKFVPQVVYADADARVLSRDLDSFGGMYTFLNIDPDLEKRVENLIVFKASDYLTVDDPEDEIQIVDDEEDQQKPDDAAEAPTPKEKPVVLVHKPVLSASTGEKRLLTVDFKISAESGLAMPKLSAADLTNACHVYTREPDEHYRMTVHRLAFKRSETVTVDSLKEAFHPSKSVNTVDAFRVRTQFDQEIFVWDSWLGIFPEYSVSGLFLTVYVGTSDSPVDTEETPGVEAVNVATYAPAKQEEQQSNLAEQPNPEVLPASQYGLVNIPEIAEPWQVTSTDTPPVVVQPNDPQTNPVETLQTLTGNPVPNVSLFDASVTTSSPPVLQWPEITQPGQPAPVDTVFIPVEQQPAAQVVTPVVEVQPQVVDVQVQNAQ